MSPTKSTKLNAAHIPSLDGVRGLAVLMVMLFHYFQGNDLRGGTLGNAINSLSHLGQTGVDLFFVLSGFLITGILLDAKGSDHYFRNFYARRSLRIFPLHYAALACVFFLPPIFGGRWVPFHEQLWGWLYAINVRTTFVGVSDVLPGHFWSLAVEEHFYLIWPAIVFVLNRRQLHWACFGCIMLSIASRAALIKMGCSPFFFTPCRLDSLAIGALLALSVRGPEGFDILSRFKPLWLLLAVTLIALPLWLKLSGSRNATGQTFKFLLIAILYGLLLAAVLEPARPLLGKFFSAGFLRTFGKYSYGLYVFDGIIPGPVRSWASLAQVSSYLHFPPLATVVSLSLHILVTLAIAVISWRLFESPILGFKRYFELKSVTHDSTANPSQAGTPAASVGPRS